MTQISRRKFKKENLIIHKSYHDKSHIFDQTIRIVCEWKRKMTNYTISISWKSTF